jgi:hypothetical protein
MTHRFSTTFFIVLLLGAAGMPALAQDAYSDRTLAGTDPLPPVSAEVLTISADAIAKARDDYIRLKVEEASLQSAYDDTSLTLARLTGTLDYVKEQLDQGKKDAADMRTSLRLFILDDLRMRIRHTESRKVQREIVEARLNAARERVDEVLEKLPYELEEESVGFFDWFDITLSTTTAGAEARLESYYLEYVTVAEFYGGLAGVVEIESYRLGNRKKPEPRSTGEALPSTRTSWIVGFMAELADRMVEIRPEVRTLDDIPDTLETFLGEAERRVILREFRRLAFNAVILNPVTHQPIEGTAGQARKYLAYSIMQNLVDFINAHNRPLTEIQQLMSMLDFFFSTTTFVEDTRAIFAQAIEKGIPKDHEFKITALAGSMSEPTSRAYFLMLAQVLVSANYKDILKFRSEYVGADESWWNVSLEKHLRLEHRFVPQWLKDHVLATTGLAALVPLDEREAAVEKRMEEYIASGEELAQLFNRAADQPDPAMLSEADRERLFKFGYINKYVCEKTVNPRESSGSPADLQTQVERGYTATIPCAEDGEIQYAYNIPRSNKGLGEYFSTARKDLDLPGASVLNAISPKEIAIMVAAAAVPEIGATLVANEIRAIGIGGVAHVASRIAADAAISAYLDTVVAAGDHYFNADPKKGPFDPSIFNKSLLDTLILNNVSSVSGQYTNKMINGVTRELAGETWQYADVFLAKAIQDEPSVSKAIYEMATNALNITQNTAITFAYNHVVHGEQVDLQKFKMAVFKGALSKMVGDFTGSVLEFINSDRIPEFYKLAMDANPALRDETIRNLEKAREQHLELVERFERVVEAHGNAPETRFHELLAGTLTWEESKALLASGDLDPEIFTEVSLQRVRHFEEMIHEGRKKAREEIEVRYQYFLKRAQETTTDTSEAERLAKKRRDDELALLMADYNPPPGAKSPTSDWDRNLKSIYLRKHLVGIWEAHQRQQTDDVLITSARAFDVNEYYNVLTFIKGNRKYIKYLRSQTTGAVQRPGMENPTPDEHFGDLTLPHNEAMAAIALSGAMRDMDPEQRELHIANKRKRMIHDAVMRARETEEVRNMTLEERTTWETSFRAELTGTGPLGEAVRKFNQKADWAKQHRLQSEAELLEIAEKIRGDRSVDDPDVRLEAQDDLYQDRLKRINELQWDLSILEMNENHYSPEALKLRGYIERLMSITMRDGIQTYTHTVGLDIIVNQVPAKQILRRQPDGSMKEDKMTVADRLLDDDFVLTKPPLSQYYSAEDIQGLIHDQVMFIVEHINKFNHGAEYEAATGRAFGKYIERYFLAEKILGRNIKEIYELPKSNPTRRLLETAQEIMRHKNDLVKIQEILARHSSKNGGTARDGLVEMFYQVEKVIPGMHGMARLKAPDVPKDAPSGLKIEPKVVYAIGGRFLGAALARAMFEIKEKLKSTAKVKGNEAVLTVIDEQVNGILMEVAYLEQEVARLLKMAKEYRSKDWELIHRFAPEVPHWQGLMASLPYQHHINPAAKSGSKTYTGFVNEFNLASQRMTNLNSGNPNISDEAMGEELANDPLTPEFRRLKNRIEFLNRLRERLLKEKAQAEEAANREAVFSAMNLSGTWSCTDADRNLGELVIVHSDNDMELTLDYSDRAQVSSTLTADADYFFGKIRGVFKDESKPSNRIVLPDMPATVRSILFDASVNIEGNKIEFSKDTSEYDGVKITWSLVSCRPKGDNTEALPAVQTTLESLEPQQAETVLAEENGYLVAEQITPDGEKLPVGLAIRMGRQRFAGPWLPPGTYRVLANPATDRVSQEVTIEAGMQTRLTLRSSGIMWRHSGPFIDRHQPVADVRSISSAGTQYATGAPDADGYTRILIKPGSYRVSFAGPGSLEFDNLEVQTGTWTIIDAVWSGIKLSSEDNQPFQVTSIQRRDDQATETLHLTTNNSVPREPAAVQEINMPPGTFVINVLKGTESISREVTLEEGAVANLIF